MAKRVVRRKVSSTKAAKSVYRAGRKLAAGDARKVLVTVAGGPMVVVEASSNEEAWEKYKQAAGIIDSDHPPQFRRPDPALRVNDAGVVVGTGEALQYSPLDSRPVYDDGEDTDYDVVEDDPSE